MAEKLSSAHGQAPSNAWEEAHSNSHDGISSDSPDEGAEVETPVDRVFQITTQLPHKPYSLPVTVSTQEQVQDLRQSITDQPDTFQYSCFHLEYAGERINDFVELADIKGLSAGSEVRLVEDPYTEKEARMHITRVRDIIGAAGTNADIVTGISSGLSLHDSVAARELDSGHRNGSSAKPDASSKPNPVADYDFEAPASIHTLLLPYTEPLPKTIKSISVSAWNPPPPHLRQKGHLLYLLLTTNEGEQFQITSHISGFYVNRSSNTKFDPFPRQAPKNASAHSLLSLISKLSPSFESSFKALLEKNSQKEPLAQIPIINTMPFSPWLVSTSESSLSSHQPDLCRTQEPLLVAGVENAEMLRDWNEEFQSTRELTKETVQDRVFRERVTSKLFADYTEAATRGAVMVARGEIAPLNPTEQADAQIYVHNNVFFSYGADGVGIFTSEGGDEAARVAVGKDIAGVRLVNQLDIDGLFTTGTVVVDYLGKRIFCQSIIPGIFRQREPGENQVDYGGVDGRDVVAENPTFVPVFSKLSKALRVKKHDVWDKEGKKHALEGSVETKGLLGTDARKYVLDLYRLTPLDVAWLEEYWTDVSEGNEKPRNANYPHRMAVLRPELIEIYWRAKLTEYVAAMPKETDEVAKLEKIVSKESEKTATDGITEDAIMDEAKNEIAQDQPLEQGNTSEAANGALVNGTNSEAATGQKHTDISGFDMAFNPDVFSGQIPQTEAEKQEWANDEEQVRTLCHYLQTTAIPELIRDLREGDVGFPMDGQSLSRLMHKRGINVRYLGKLAEHAASHTYRLDALCALATQEMVVRAFKHIAFRYLRDIPPVFATSCIAHLLNCLLGGDLNADPKTNLNGDLQSLHPEAEWYWTQANPETLRAQIKEQIHARFRFDLGDHWVSSIKHLQMLREISLKLGLQLTAKEYQFKASQSPKSPSSPVINGISTNTNGTGHGKKKKKGGDHDSLRQSNESLVPAAAQTFEADDIVNFVPIIKDASPRSMLADEALEAARLSIAQNQKDLGMDLLVESLTLHESIYGIPHPEVARVYHQLAMIYYQLDEKTAAVELARKAVIVSERILGIDCNETILSYLNLGLFEHANGNTKLALCYIRHALELWKIIFGLRHPDSITTMNNAAVMLQHMRLYHDSRLWFEKSLEICEEVSGKTSVGSATIKFQLAQALALDQEPKAAVSRMREAYNIFRNELGPDDRNTKESEGWLDQLTQNAVSIAKHAKDMQNRRLRRIQLTPQVTLGTRPQPQVGQSSAEVAGVNRSRPVSTGMDPRNLDELIRFIEGGGDSTKRTPNKKRGQRTNPKRRGGGSQTGGLVT